MISHWLGWISFAMCILLLAKYVGRISKKKKLNQILRKIHKPLGIAVIGIGAIHGLICFIKNPQAIIQNITGFALLVSLVFLAMTFYMKSKFKAKWFQMHKHLAILLIVVMIIHTAVSFS